MKFIDDLLNRITMYRLVVYGLALESIVCAFLAGIGKLAIDPGSLVKSAAVLGLSCLISEVILAKIWRRPWNHESWLITSLILFLILRPPQTTAQAVALLLAGIVAVSSKYILAWHDKQLFNPAAFAAAFLSLTSLYPASWWVGNSRVWPLTLVVGLLIIRKIRRFQMVLTFALVSLAFQSLLILHHHQPLHSGLVHAAIASPLIFLSTIMLSEPATMPPRSDYRLVFAALVAIFYIGGWKVGPVYTYPEVALLVGNVFAFLVAPKFRLTLRLKAIRKISDQVYSYIFTPSKSFAFAPGQYMEWTLPNVAFDARGNRRTFTIASSPTEKEVILGVKFYNPSSAFKYAMSRLQPGDEIFASQLAGSFTLAGNEKKKLVFIAGGIGITPFRSMIKYLDDQSLSGDIILIYLVSKPEELAFKDELLEARRVGVKLVPVLSGSSKKVPGFVSANLSLKLVSWAAADYKERLFYISGPDAMVRSAKHLLLSMGVAHSHIKTDYFSGY